jgi:hypothetical protein
MPKFLVPLLSIGRVNVLVAIFAVRQKDSRPANRGRKGRNGQSAQTQAPE